MVQQIKNPVKRMVKVQQVSSSYHHGNLREVLIDAAVKMIAEEGAEALSLRKIALRAGVSHAAPYRHFKDKEAILVAVAKQGFEMLLDQTHQRLNKSKGDELDRFALIGLSSIDFASSFPSHYRVMFGTRSDRSSFKDALPPQSSEIFQLLRETISDCRDKHLLKQGDIQEMTLAAWSIVHGFAMLLIDRHIQADRMDPEKMKSLKHTVVLTLYQGLKP